MKFNFFNKKKDATNTVPYDPEKQHPVIRCSICNGEQLAGFKDRQTGHFTEVMLIKTDKDLEIFKKMYGLTEISKEY